MPKTSNLRAQLIDISQAGSKTFTITVTVWEAPGSADSPNAVRFQFQTHANPALWWRLSMTSARKAVPPSREQARYTNAMYNKALRTATDALNAFLIRESDSKLSKAGSPLQPNVASTGTRSLTYGTMPSEVDFFTAVASRFGAPFLYTMDLKNQDAAAVERAADLSRVDLADRNGLTSVTSPNDFYRIIDALRFMGSEFDNQRAYDIASAMLGHAGFEWV